MTMHHKIWWNP